MRGLALEGGGAKGAYQIGAYKALMDLGYSFDAVSGTSIGSINAALIAQGDGEYLEKLWLEIDARIFGMDPDIVHELINHKINLKTIKSSAEVFTKILKNKGIDTTKFHNVLTKYIHEDKIRASKVKFGLVTLRIKDLTPLELTIDDIPQGKLIEYIMASCYLPVFTMKKIIDENYYLDGGFTNVLPITLLENMGCDEIIGIRLKKFGLIKKKKNPDTKVTIIQPKKNIGSIILIDKERIIANSKLGYYDTLKQLKGLDGNTYYFKRRSKRFYRYICRDIKRTEYEALFKKYRVMDIKELVIKVLEKIAMENHIDIYEVYDPWKLIKRIKKKYIFEKNSTDYWLISKIKNY